MAFVTVIMKPMSTVGKGVQEIRIRTEDAYRIFYVARFEEAIYVLHAFHSRSVFSAREATPTERESTN
jgi:phage-related protein